MLTKAPPTKAHMRNFGIDIGIGFKPKDDWLDVFGDRKIWKAGRVATSWPTKNFLLITAFGKCPGKDKNDPRYTDHHCPT